MTRATSIYLDSVRFLAATVVFFAHARHVRFTDGWLMMFKNYGNDAVMVFFVLSGFVIAYCVDTKEKTMHDYLISRFARLYSVVFPALCLTVVFDAIGLTFDYSIYIGDCCQFSAPFTRFFSNLFFLNQIWFFNITPFSNNPFWSLGYEFWYYILFAAYIFLKDYTRWLCICLIMLFIGIKILLLFPIWLLGVLSYRICKTNTLSLGLGWSLFIGSMVIYISYRYYEMPLWFSWHIETLMGHPQYQKLWFSKEFLSSYIVGILISSNFIGFNAISRSVNTFFLNLERPIRFFASYTFTLYLLHYPLLNFYAAILANEPSSIKDQIILFTCTVLSIFIIGNFTEHKKHQYKNLFEKLTSMMFSHLVITKKL